MKRPVRLAMVLAAALVLVAAAAAQTSGRALRVLVVDVHGTPVPAAEIEATLEWEPERVLARGRTDATGLFVHRVPRDAPLGILARVRGRGVGRSLSNPLVDRTDEILVELHDVDTVTGTVVDAERRPLVGARVRWSLRKAPSVTDAAGRFVLDEVPLGWRDLYVVHERGTMHRRFFLRERTDLEVPVEDAGPPLRVRVHGLPKGADCDLDLRCQRAADPTRPVDETPIHDVQRMREDGAEVFVLHGLGKHLVRIEPRADGFRFDPPTRHAGHEAGVLEFVATAAPERVLNAAPVERGTQRDAEPRASVRGRLLGPDGSPAVGAFLRIERELGWGDPAVFLVQTRLVTDADGRFTLSGESEPGTLRLRHVGSARRIGPGAVVHGPFALDRGEQLDLGEIRLAAPATLTCNVRDRAGRPVPGAHLHLRRSGETTLLARHNTTDRDGRWVAAWLAPGEYRLELDFEVATEPAVQVLELRVGETKTLDWTVDVPPDNGP